MSREALPCIVCGHVLGNVIDDVINQPYEGTAFESEGHYGSTEFDPMDGSYLEINVCDRCLVTARERGRVLWGRQRKPVLCEGTLVGWCKTPGRPLIPWTGNEGSAFGDQPSCSNDVLVIEPEELGSELLPEIEWIKEGRA